MSKRPAKPGRFSASTLVILGASVVMILSAVVLILRRPAASGNAPAIVPTGRSDASAVLNPMSFHDMAQQHAYTVAHKAPEVLNQLFCWCHCRESTIFHHRSLLECFESDHASQCSICMGEAALAYSMVQRGVTDIREIQHEIDGQYGPRSRGST